ncbi:hypothetical protein XELAEV_18010900mg [Xenopus laevis]|uniref:Uncharacterized protein n=1 Tax=Xenopus laevis TaxID=8355 RepID=A0A974DV32_XENLA|nr:hypothetical protein XELAEV_18010900mg [Xenopus laevis]
MMYTSKKKAGLACPHLQTYYRATLLSQLADWHLPPHTKSWVDLEHWIYKYQTKSTITSSLWAQIKRPLANKELMPLPITAMLRIWQTSKSMTTLVKFPVALAPLTTLEGAIQDLNLDTWSQIGIQKIGDL